MTTTDKLGPPWDMDELMSALRAAHEDLEAGRPVVWTGPTVTWCALAAVDVVPVCFEVGCLLYHSRNDRNHIDVLLRAALHLGMEQGARTVNLELQELVDDLVGHIESENERLHRRVAELEEQLAARSTAS